MSEEKTPDTGFTMLNAFPKKWMAVVVGIFLVISTCATIAFSIYDKAKDEFSSAEKEKSVSVVKLFTGPPKTGNHDYLQTAVDTTISKASYLDFRQFRAQVIRQALGKADQQLVAAGQQPYAAKLGAYFESSDDIQRAFFDDLVYNYVLVIREEVQTKKDRYRATISVDREAASDVDSLVQIFSDAVCRRQALDTLIMTALREKGEIQISLSWLFQHLCEKCSGTRRYIELMRSNCIDGTGDCSRLYFQKGAYQLNALSMLLLQSLADLLNESSLKNVTLQFEGYADSSPVEGDIPIPEGCPTAGNGVILDEKSDTSSKLYHIESNDELALARSWNSWEFMRSRMQNAQIALSYTGRGVSISGGTQSENRNVQIIIKKIKNEGQ